MKRSTSLAMWSTHPIRIGVAAPVAVTLEAKHQIARHEAVRRLGRTMRFWSVARLACPWRWEALTALREDAMETRDRLKAAFDEVSVH